MNCPPEIAVIILKILETAILRIRWLGWNGDADRCAVEADHVHNLPNLLSSFFPALLLYYWRVQKVGFENQNTGQDLAMFRPHWEALELHVRLAELAEKP